MTLCNIIMYNATILKDTKTGNFNSWEAIPSRKGGGGGTNFPKGEQYFIGNFTRGCHIHWGPKFPVTPEQEKAEHEKMSRAKGSNPGCSQSHFQPLTGNTPLTACKFRDFTKIF